MTHHLMRLRTEKELQNLRENLERYERARNIRDQIVQAAIPWLDRPDEFLRAFIPGPEVPRSFYVHFKGCPVHGRHQKAIRDHRWIWDPWTDPWKVICPIGGEAYPSNDFGAFLRSGMKDRSLLAGDYVDDGWGYRKPGEEFKYWFIGFCCRNIWSTVLSGVQYLSRAYLLTEEDAYAHKALVMLDRIAEVYPAMDYSTQSMYAEEASPGYTGKIGSLISETHVLVQLCEAYDSVRSAIEGDPMFVGKANRLTAHLDEGLVKAGIRGVYEGDVRGNYGMHQYALLVAAMTLGDPGEIEQAVDWVMNHTGEPTRLKEMWTLIDDVIFRDKAGHAEGLNFAFDNLIFREGIGWESSPGYCSSWIHHLIQVGEALERLGIHLFDRPKMRRMLYWPGEMAGPKTFSPNIGDNGSITSGAIALSPQIVRVGFEHYSDPALAQMLLDQGYVGEGSIRTYEDLFRLPLDQAMLEKVTASVNRRPDATSSMKNTHMGGYGLVVLRSGEGERATAVSVYYGRAATEHGHFDRLTLELFGYGRRLLPDLGYPEVAMEAKKPAAWTKNTASHNTVVVDERRQDTAAPGQVRHLVSRPGLQYLDVSAPDTYTSTSLYRREVALVDLDADHRYVLDVFRVEGSDQHDYSLHGFDGIFSTEGITLSEPQKRGTLAGENVAFGELYDQKDLDRPHKSESYYRYRGSGYSYLRDVQRGTPEGVWHARWKAKDAEAGVRVMFLPDSTKEVVVATGEPPLREGVPDELKYILLRNAGSHVRSTFAAVMEPFEGEESILSVEPLPARSSSETPFDLVAARIRHQRGTDILISSNDESVQWTIGDSRNNVSDGIRFQGRFGLIRVDDQGNIVKMELLGCGHLKMGTEGVEIAKPLHGRIAKVYEETHQVEVDLDGESDALRPEEVIGETIVIGNGRHRTSYTITGIAEQNGRVMLSLGEDTFRIGKVPVDHLDPDGAFLATNTYLYLAAHGYYRGTRLVDEQHTVSLRVEDVKLVPHKPYTRRAGRITVVDEVNLRNIFRVGDTAYLYDFGPGDRWVLTPHASLES